MNTQFTAPRSAGGPPSQEAASGGTAGDVRGDSTPAVPEVLPGWSLSLSLVRGHYVPHGAAVRLHHDGRPIAMGVCGWPGYVDEDGRRAADLLVYHCHSCQRRLVGVCSTCWGLRLIGRSKTDSSGATSYWDETCDTCGGTGRLPPIAEYLG